MCTFLLFIVNSLWLMMLTFMNEVSHLHDQYSHILHSIVTFYNANKTKLLEYFVLLNGLLFASRKLNLIHLLLIPVVINSVLSAIKHSSTSGGISCKHPLFTTRKSFGWTITALSWILFTWSRHYELTGRFQIQKKSLAYIFNVVRWQAAMLCISCFT